MNYRFRFALLSGLLLRSASLYAQSITLYSSRLLPNQVALSFERAAGKDALRVVNDSTVWAADEPTVESIYIRPTNGRVTDQVRRNHAIQ